MSVLFRLLLFWLVWNLFISPKKPERKRQKPVPTAPLPRSDVDLPSAEEETYEDIPPTGEETDEAVPRAKDGTWEDLELTVPPHPQPLHPEPEPVPRSVLTPVAGRARKTPASFPGPVTSATIVQSVVLMQALGECRCRRPWCPR